MDSIPTTKKEKAVGGGGVVKGQGSTTATAIPHALGTFSHFSSDCVNGKCIFLLIYLY